MSAAKYDGGPAFPSEHAITTAAGYPVRGPHQGMSLRQHYAGQAMVAMISGSWPDAHDREEIAKRAFHMADAMIAAGLK